MTYRSLLLALCAHAGDAPHNVVTALASVTAAASSPAKLKTILALLSASSVDETLVIALVDGLNGEDEATLAGARVVLPTGVQARLARSRRLRCVRALAARADLDGNVAAGLVCHADDETRHAVLTNPALPTSVRTQQWSHGNFDGYKLAPICAADPVFAEHYVTAALVSRALVVVTGAAGGSTDALMHLLGASALSPAALACIEPIVVNLVGAPSLRSKLYGTADQATVGAILAGLARQSPKAMVVTSVIKILDDTQTIDIHARVATDPLGVRPKRWAHVETLIAAHDLAGATHHAALAHPELPDELRHSAVLSGDFTGVAHNPRLTQEEVGIILDGCDPGLVWRLCAVDVDDATRERILMAGPSMLRFLRSFHENVDVAPSWFARWTTLELCRAVLHNREAACGTRLAYTRFAEMAYQMHPELLDDILDTIEAKDPIPAAFQPALRGRLASVLADVDATTVFAGLACSWEGSVMALAECAQLTAVPQDQIV